MFEKLNIRYFRRSTVGMLFAVAAILCADFSYSQKNITYNNQQWFHYNNRLVLSKKITLYSDMSLRRRDNLDKWSQITLRTGLGYRLKNNVNFISGIACFESFTENRPSRIEFRAYEEINTLQNYRRFSVQHRYRIEARYFRAIEYSKIQPTSSFNFRYRYRVFCKVPLCNVSAKRPKQRLSLTVGDEIMINSGKQIGNNMLDNNRLLLGGSLQLNDQMEMFLTYNYQFGQRTGKFDYESSDILWVGVFHTLHRRKMAKP